MLLSYSYAVDLHAAESYSGSYDKNFDYHLSDNIIFIYTDQWHFRKQT